MGILLTHKERGHNIDCPPWTPYWSDCFQTRCDPYLELEENRSNCLLCFGDSWTWGDSLVQNLTGSDKDDPSIRIKHVYGRQLADRLDADFVNCAIPGIFNFWIIDKLNVIINHDIARLSNRYKKVYVVVTLTEIGRDFEFDLYVKNFEEFAQNNISSAPQIVEWCERFDFYNLGLIEKKLPENCQLIVGRNFTHTQSANQNLLSYLLPTSWSDLLFSAQGLETQNNVIMMTHGTIHFDRYIRSRKLDDANYKIWFEKNIYKPAMNQIDLLDKSIYNYKIASKHPTIEGHDMWANYILTTLSVDQYLLKN